MEVGAGTAPANWPDNHTFLGRPTDPATSLDLLGARQYDPVTGAFLSADPVYEAGQPLQMGGYAYAANNPATHADPTGLLLPGGAQCGQPGAPKYNPPLARVAAVAVAVATVACRSAHTSTSPPATRM